MNRQITFEKLSRFDRIEEPCAVAIPFAKGKLADLSRFGLYDGDRQIPAQAQATAFWPDQSVKWLHVDMLVDLPANQNRTFTWSVEATGQADSDSVVRVERNGEGWTLNTGVATLRLGGPGKSPALGELDLATWGLGAQRMRGPVLTDDDGTAWTATLDDKGWEVLKEGPIRVVMRAAGTHRSENGEELVDFTLTVHAFAGKPWFQIDYRLINREPTPHVMIRELALDITPDNEDADVSTALGISNYRTRIRRGSGDEILTHCIDAEQLIYESNEQVPEVNYGTFWADWRKKGAGGLCVTVHQAQQNFPKALTVDKQGIHVAIYPESKDLLCLRQGVARTQRFFLHPHTDEETVESLNVRSLQFQMPDRPALASEIYREADVFEPVWVDERIPSVEAFLIDSADERTRGYGMLNWGDGPDPGYSNQGRGHGKPVWTNNEYDLPHAAMLMLARTGERRMLDYLLVTAEHQMDVDVCHFSEDAARLGGQITHSAHHSTGSVTPSHMWVEGLLDLYHVTADPEARDTAVGIGKNLLGLLQRPAMRQAAASSARETGWALRALVALYRETHDETWLEPAEFIVQQFKDWHQAYGAWLAPYTDHTLARVPFMISVAACSLMRYYWLTEDVEVGRLIVAAMRDLLDHALMPDGRFYYKELPSLQRRGAGLYVLEGLAYAYDLSGDDAFIRAGMPTFREALKEKSRGSGVKTAVDDAVIWERGASPKAFASRFLPVVMFYRNALKAGLASDLQ